MAIPAILAACVTAYPYDVTPTVENLGFGKKRPLRVALLISPEDGQRVFSKKGRADYTANFSVGAGLVRAAPEVYGQVFRVLTRVDTMAAGEAHDLVVRPRVTELDFRWAWPGLHAVRIHLAVSVFAGGKPLGQRTYVSKEHSLEVRDLNRDVNRITSRALVESLAASARDFTQRSELARQVAAAVAGKRRTEESLVRDLESVNLSLRVVASEAVVRAAPADDQFDLDTYPMGSVVHAIGYLPSGWYRIAKEGKPFGWLHESAVRSEQAGQPSAAATMGAKPTIFLAYPKGGEELAEESVDVLGYVTVPNRTDRMQVLVNGRSYSPARLWSGTPLETAGLRGFPLTLSVPLRAGSNLIEIQVFDGQGFVERATVKLSRIRVDRSAPAKATALAGLPARIADVEVTERAATVTADNFIQVLESWVLDTAKTDFNKGNAMFDQGRYARAAYYYGKSIATDASGRAWFNLGLCQVALGNRVKADAAFASACRMEVAPACKMAS